MFESLASNIITALLGEYIENVDPKSLNIAIFKGNLDLYDLKLKKTALDSFNLPVTVVQGLLGHLRLQIPWTSLETKPVIAEISDLFLVVQPRKNVQLTEEERIKQEQESKQKQLKSYETYKEAKKKKEKDAKKKEQQDKVKKPKVDDEKKKNSPSFVSKLTEKIVNNLQVRINNVHARYEDVSNSEQKILLGFTMKDLRIDSCNDFWEKAFIKEALKCVFKLFEVSELSAYMNRQDTILYSSIKSPTEFKQLMQKSISDPHKEYLVRPIQGIMKLTIQRDEYMDFSQPKFKADLEFSNFSVQLNDLQYRNFLRIAAYFSSYRQIEENVRRRPKSDLSTQEGRFEWMQIAFQAAHRSVRKNYFTWDDVIQRKKDKIQYIDLYKKKKGVEWLPKITPEETEQLNQLEIKLKVDDLVLYEILNFDNCFRFRELAEAEAKEEAKKYEDVMKQRNETKKKGWFNWSKQNPADQQPLNPSQFKLSDEDREKLYKSIGYDAQSEIAQIASNKDYVLLNINFLLSNGDIQLQDSATNQSIVEIQFTDLKADIKKKTENVLLEFTLGDLLLVDRFTQETPFRVILRRRSEALTAKQSLGCVTIETSPPGGKSDYYVYISLEEMDFYMNVPLTQKILCFFSLPSDVSLGALQSAARKQLNNLQQQATTALKIALENKTVLDLQLHIHSPRFIVPEKCSNITDDMPIVVVDFGKLSIVSDTHKAEREKRLKHDESTEDDYYDKFKLNMTDIQVLVSDFGRLFGNTVTADNLIEKISLHINLGLCITPTNDNLIQTKLTGEIPSIQANVAPERLEVLIRLFRMLYSLIDDPTGQSRARSVKRGVLHVTGPIVDDNQIASGSYWVELRSNKIAIYEHDYAPKALVNVYLSDIATVKDSKEDAFTDAFSISLPQSSGADMQYTFRGADRKMITDWMEAVRQNIMVHKSNKQVQQDTQEEKHEEQLSRTKIKVLIHFHLGKLIGVVSYKNQNISKVNLGDIDFKLQVRNFDKTISLSLNSFEILNMMDSPFKYVLTSGKKSEDLASMTIISTAANSPYWDADSKWCSVLKDSATAMIFDFKSAEFFFDPQVISKYIRFGIDIGKLIGTQLQTRVRAIRASTKKITEVIKNVEDKRLNSFNLEAHLQNASFTLIDFGTTFLSLSLSSGSLQILNTPSDLFVRGELGNVQALDTTPDALYKELLGLSSKKHSLINFTFSRSKLIDEDAGLEEPIFDKEFKMVMHSVKLVFLMRLVSKLRAYFSEGPIYQAASYGTQKAAAKTIEVVAKQTIRLLKLDIELINPLIVVPIYYSSNDQFIGNLGKIKIYNTIEKDAHSNWLDQIHVDLKEMNLMTILNRNLSLAVENVNIDVLVRRVVKMNQNVVPSLDIHIQISEITVKCSQIQYSNFFQLLRHNLMDSEFKYVSQEIREKKSKATNNEKDVIVESLSTPVDNAPVTVDQVLNIDLPKLNVTILRGEGIFLGREDTLASAQMLGFKISYTYRSDKSYTVGIDILDVSAHDKRVESLSAFKEFISSRKQGSVVDMIYARKDSIRPSHEAHLPVSSNLDLEHFMKLRIDQTAQSDLTINLNMSDPRFIFVPDIVAELKNYFTSVGEFSDRNSVLRMDRLKFEEQGDTIISTSIWLDHDIVLSPKTRLYFAKRDVLEIVLDGCGHTICMLTNDKSDVEPVFLIADGINVRFKNVRLKYTGDLQFYVQHHPASLFVTPATHGVYHEHLDNEASKTVSPKTPTSSTPKTPMSPSKQASSKMTFQAEFGKPTILFPENATVLNTRFLVLGLKCKARYNKELSGEEIGVFSIENMRAHIDSTLSKHKSAAIIEPISLNVTLDSTTFEKGIHRLIKVLVDSELKARIAYQDVKLITTIAKAFVEKLRESEDDKKNAIEKAMSQIEMPASSPLSPKIKGSDSEIAELLLEATVAPTPQSSRKRKEHVRSKSLSEYELDVVSPDEKKPVVVAAPKEQADAQEQVIEIKFSSSDAISLLLVDDIRGFDIPLITLRVGDLEFDANIILKHVMNVTMALHFKIQAHYYNLLLSEWEPIVEHWGCIAAFKRSPTGSALVPYQNDLLIANEPNVHAPLNINISKSMIETILTTAKLWKEGLSSQTVSQKFHAYLFRNFAGETVSLHQEDEAESVADIPSGKEFGHDFAKKQLKKDLLIQITVPNVGAIAVNIRKGGKSRLVSKDGTKVVVIEIEHVEGRKIISIRSAIKLFNDTTVAWEVGYYNAAKLDKVESIGVVEPQGWIGIPICDVNKTILAVKPVHDAQYKWSPAVSGLTLFRILPSVNTQKLFSCANLDAAQRSFNCILKVEQFFVREDASAATISSFKGLDFVLRLRPPLAVENLLGVPMDYVMYERADAKSNRIEYAKGTLQKGEKAYLYSTNVRNTILMKPIIKGWNSNMIAVVLSNDTKGNSKTMQLNDLQNNPLHLYFDYFTRSGIAYHEVLIYTQYWLVNTTGKKLSINFDNQIMNLEANTEPSPHLFSFKDKNAEKHKVAISVEKTPFSRLFAIHNPGMTGDVELNRFNVGFHVYLAPGKFSRTKLVSFCSRYVICNQTDIDIDIQQYQSNQVVTLKPAARHYFYWADKNLGQLLTFAVNNRFQWCDPIKLNALGDMPIKLLSKESVEPPYILSVNISQQDAAIYAVISKPDKPPYLINNMTKYDIEIAQTGTNHWYKVRKESRFPYTWDNLHGMQKLDLRIGDAIIHSYHINLVAKKQTRFDLPIGDKKTKVPFYACVIAKGPTRILRIAEVEDIREQEQEIIETQFTAMVAKLGLSLINDKPAEISYVYLDDLAFRFCQSNLNRFIEFKLVSLQVDNQVPNAPFPVIISRTKHVQDNPLPFVHFSLCQSVREKQVNLFPYFSVNVQEADISIDYSFIMTLVSFLSNLSLLSSSDDGKNVEKLLTSAFEPKIDDIDTSASKLYFNSFELHPIKVNVTFKFNKLDQEESNNAVTLLLDSIGITVVNIDDAPIRLNALLLEHPFVTSNALVDRIKQHYIRAGTIELYKILGSLDVIGNPVGLFNDLGTGVKDFFYEPASAITKSPDEFAKGVAKGTGSLVSKSIHGTFNTASKVTGFVGKSIKLLTLDNEYIKESELASTKNRPKDLKEGLIDGSEALVKGFVRSVTDVVTKPMEGASKEGATGFVKDLSIALIGVPTKQIAGILDFAQKTTEAISNSQREFHGRARYPRIFREDGALLPYNAEAAFEQYMLDDLKSQKMIPEDDTLVCCAESEKGTYLLLTSSHLVFIKEKHVVLQWKMEVVHLVDVAKESKKQILIVRFHERKQGLFGTGTTAITKPFHIANANKLNQFFDAIYTILKNKKQ